MLRTPRILVALFLITVITAASSCTTNRACKLSINKKKLDYYNGLQYRGAKKR